MILCKSLLDNLKEMKDFLVIYTLILLKLMDNLQKNFSMVEMLKPKNSVWILQTLLLKLILIYLLMLLINNNKVISINLLKIQLLFNLNNNNKLILLLNNNNR